MSLPFRPVLDLTTDDAELCHEAWLEAALEATRKVLSEADPHARVHRTIRRLREVSGADLVKIKVVVAPGLYCCMAADGLGLEGVEGTMMPLTGLSLSAAIVESGERAVSKNLTAEKGYDPAPSVAEAQSVLGPCIGIPLVVTGEVIGLFVIAWRRGAPLSHLSNREVQWVRLFAGQVALALQQPQAYRLVMQDRSRIAGELRDPVLYRLLTVSSHLHGTASLVTQRRVQQRMLDASRDLDEISQQVRTVIFELGRDDAPDKRSPSSQVVDEIGIAERCLGLTPRLVIDGPLDRSVPPYIQSELLQAIRNAITNAGTHGPPSFVEIRVQVANDQLTLTVSDDGRPVDQPAFQSALAQLIDQAQRLGGMCSVLPREASGPIVTWRVPLPGNQVWR